MSKDTRSVVVWGAITALCAIKTGSLGLIAGAIGVGLVFAARGEWKARQRRAAAMREQRACEAAARNARIIAAANGHQDHVHVAAMRRVRRPSHGRARG